MDIVVQEEGRFLPARGTDTKSATAVMDMMWKSDTSDSAFNEDMQFSFWEYAFTAYALTYKLTYEELQAWHLM